jgi:hypothetical protein
MIWQAVDAGSATSSARPATPAPAPTAPVCAAGRPASGARPTWRWRTGCSTPRGTVTCSCTPRRGREDGSPNRRSATVGRECHVRRPYQLLRCVAGAQARESCGWSGEPAVAR